MINDAKDTDPHPAFLEFLKTLDKNELAKMAIDMKRAGDDEAMIRLVIDEMKLRK